MSVDRRKAGNWNVWYSGDELVIDLFGDKPKVELVRPSVLSGFQPPREYVPFSRDDALAGVVLSLHEAYDLAQDIMDAIGWIK